MFSEDFQSAIVNAAFAAAQAATCSMSTPLPSYTYSQGNAYIRIPSEQPPPNLLVDHQLLRPAAQDPQPLAARPPQRVLSEVTNVDHSGSPDVAADVSSKPHEQHEAALHTSFQMLLQHHAAELESRRRIEEELQSLRKKYDELHQEHQSLVTSFHKAETDKCVAIANAKAAEKAAKEREASIEKLEQQVRKCHTLMKRWTRTSSNS